MTRTPDLILRIGLVSAAMLSFHSTSILWSQGESFHRPANLFIDFALWALAATLLVLALVHTVPRRAECLILLAALIDMGVQAHVLYQNATPLTISHTDNEMIAQFAAEALQQGENPYTWNFADMLRAYRDQGTNYTPFVDGAYQYRVTYPALPTLIYAALDWTGLDFGLGLVRSVSLIMAFAMLILVFVGAPASMRPLVLLPIFVMSDILGAALNGVQDIVWSVCLIGVILTWKHPLRRALLYGIACSFRQQPWFVAPFLLIHLWHEGGTPRMKARRIVTFFAVSSSVFILSNLAFVLWNPQAWAAGAFEPSYADFNYLSMGFGILTEYGIVPLPREFYTVAQISSLAIMLLLHWRYAPVIGQGFWIFPGFFFWFYYRGLLSYWSNWVPVMLVVIAGGAESMLTGPAPSTMRVSRHRFVLVLVLLILGANITWGIMLIRQAPHVDLSYTPPIETYHAGLANRLHVTVQNRSDRVMAPRFAVRARSSAQTLPWHIVSGPLYLRPGEQGDYVIDAQTIPSRGFPIDRGAQVVVTDANGNYALYSTLLIPAMIHARQVDGIANADYRYWPPDSLAPERWTLVPPRGGIPTLRLDTLSDHVALVVEADTDPNASSLPIVRVQQEIVFPESLTLWVHPTQTPLHPEQYVYGVELDDGLHRLWVLCGTAGHDRSGSTTTGQPHIILHDSPPDVWSQVTIDFRALYDNLGWEVPASGRFVEAVTYQAPVVRLSLMAGARSDQTEKWVFGPIEHTPWTQAAIIAASLEHPDAYYTDLGADYLQQRNFARAEDSYHRAIDYNAGNAAAYFGLGESRFWQAEYAQADAAYNKALALGYPNVGDVQKGIAWSQFNLGHYKAAQAAFEAAITFYRMAENEQLAPSLADAYQGAGWVWVRWGDCTQALTSFEQALVAKRDTPGALEGLAYCQNSPDF